MFYPSKILGIKEKDKVLEVGPGADPYFRSDILLEIDLDEHRLEAQRGYTKLKNHGKKTIYYDGGKFPFEDKEFDYVIASHVIEHVEDVELFVHELMRVAHAGYLEFPTILYEYLYNFDVHLNLINYHKGIVYYSKKSIFPFSGFSSIQAYYRDSLSSGYSQLVDSLQKDMFIGFEWKENIEFQSTDDISLLVPPWTSGALVRQDANDQSRALHKRIIHRVKKLIK